MTPTTILPSAPPTADEAPRSATAGAALESRSPAGIRPPAGLGGLDTSAFNTAEQRRIGATFARAGKRPQP